MEKIIKIVDESRGIVQITTLDERWYGEQVDDEKTGLPKVEWLPSITYITSYCPKGIEYSQYIAKKGWDEAERIKNEAADRGTVVHRAVETLLNDKVIRMDQLFKDREGNERQMTPYEYYCVMTFDHWHKSVGRPNFLHLERTVKSKKHGYAGTLDAVFVMGDGSTILVDFKTSKSPTIYPYMKAQLSALEEACTENGIHIDRRAILQLGYMANKIQHYKFTEVTNKFNLFQAAKEFWIEANSGDKPLQRDYPLEIRLTDAPLVKEDVSESDEK